MASVIKIEDLGSVDVNTLRVLASVASSVNGKSVTIDGQTDLLILKELIVELLNGLSSFDTETLICECLADHFEVIAATGRGCPHVLEALIEKGNFEIYGSDFEKFEYAQTFPPLHRTCLKGDHRIARFFLKLGANVWVKGRLLASVNKSPRMLTGTDLDHHVRDTAVYCTLVGDHVHVLQVLLEYSMMEEITHHDLTIACVTMGAERCVQYLMSCFHDQISDETLRYTYREACVCQPKMIQTLLTKGAKVDDAFVATFPGILEQLYSNFELQEKQCLEVTQIILSDASEYQISQLVTLETLKVLLKRLLEKGDERPFNAANFEHCVDNIVSCLEVLVKTKPKLIAEGDGAVYTMIDGMHRNHNSDLSRLSALSFLRGMVDQGFTSKCYHSTTRVCALPRLFSIFNFDRTRRDGNTRVGEDFLHLVEGFLMWGCDPNTTESIRMICDKVEGFRPVSGGESQSVEYFRVMMLEAADVMNLQIRCFAMLRNSGLLISCTVDDVPFPLTLVKMAIDGIGKSSQNISYLYLSACILAEANLDVLRRDVDFIHSIHVLLNLCSRDLFQIPEFRGNHQENAVFFLCYLLSLMDQKQINATAVPFLDILPEEVSGVSRLSPGCQHLLHIKSRIPHPLCLKRICVLFIRKLLLTNCEEERSRKIFQGIKGDSMTEIIDQTPRECLKEEVEQGNFYYITSEGRNFILCKNPINSNILGQLQVPNTIRDDISGIGSLLEFLHNICGLSMQSQIAESLI